jgi:radical SAM protein with 4Fe4S-binding SPASM domain
MGNDATLANIRRKSSWADNVQMHAGRLLPSWIDLNPTELCGRSAGSPRACVFCPRIDPALYPNQALHMPVALARKIGDELRALRYEGAVVLCGFGEPMLHPHLVDVVQALSGLHVEMVTNGDHLTVSRICQLRDAGLSFFVVSMYDGPHQVAHFGALFGGADCSHYLLRDRWHTAKLDFGLKLTNRAGATRAGHQPAADATRPCFYPAYSMTVDWQGDVLLCPQDWHKRVRFGNLQSQSLMDIWLGRAMRKRRAQLLSGRRCETPCSGCNADGTVHGGNHAELWRAYDGRDAGLGEARDGSDCGGADVRDAVAASARH